ncbi:cytochrome c oxidase subunit 3 [Rhodospirillum centenum]|uniref:Cytochrome c oxidase subunit 3 n=1 Tax=Rhodospirillum centenum (strain ATCC 51521 / SW) TaxID=414684 RepID=B6IXG0_RHOCS|nr:cytochrome c oxidase subunit 3 [Rhodospirillum centenum]ACJ00984.1 cytochrome c oxidase subunit III (Heme/copper-type cytochrome/quinol oxidases) [Rhodospirillum centenum SW]
MADVKVHSAPAGAVPEGVKQPYHLVDPSPWPLLGAFAGGLLATGAILYMHDHGWAVLAAGFLAVLGVMAGWWRDVVRESVVQRAHTPVVKIGLRYGMVLFIASEVMFFVAFFWAFFDASLYAAEPMQVARTEATGGQWPPAGIEPINPFDLPLMMTVILLLSGSTVTWAHHAIIEGKQAQAVKALGITVALGALFTLFQLYEYSHASFGFADNIYSSTFYMATGFHGFHVLIGTIFLAVCWFRASRGHFTPQSHFGLEAAAWYWHFVDVVWLFLFVSIYWWGAGGQYAAH